MYSVLASKKAVKYYENLDDKSASRINKAVEAIGMNPLEGRHIKRLSGLHSGKYRYAVGSLRIIYRVSEIDKKVLIEAIGPRGDIYK
jgi:mRNA interferase RelE/StbE